MSRIYTPIFREIERYSVSNSIAKSVRMVILIPFISATLILSSIFSPGFAADGQFDYPDGIEIDHKGNVFVADTVNDRIQKFTNNGTFIREWGIAGNGQNGPVGVAIDSSDNVFVADTHNNRIQKFTNTGKFIRKWGDTGTDNGQFHLPGDVGIDPKGNVFVADSGNDRIQKFTNTGKFIRKWSGNGGGGNITTTSLSSPF
jgi:tripartite motif-containing protein 71